MKLSKRLQQELKSIGKHQPVFSGDLLSKDDTKELVNLKLVMTYESDYVLTEKGKQVFNNYFPDIKLGNELSRSYK